MVLLVRCLQSLCRKFIDGNIKKLHCSLLNEQKDRRVSLCLQSLNGGKPQFSGFTSRRELITSSAVLNSAVFLGTDGTAMTCIPAAFTAVTPGLAQPLFTMLMGFFHQSTSCCIKFWASKRNGYPKEITDGVSDVSLEELYMYWEKKINISSVEILGVKCDCVLLNKVIRIVPLYHNAMLKLSVKYGA